MKHFLVAVAVITATLLVAIFVTIALFLVDRAFPPLHPLSPVPVASPGHTSPTVSPASSSTSGTPSTQKSEPVRKSVMTTVFWVGEGSTAENGYISNVQSYWDEYWGESFGGVDDPEDRCGYAPCAFTPKENPFYIALPYTEFNKTGTAYKESAKSIPWFGKDNLPLLKNRWVEVVYRGKTCYGQWQDVGPFLEDDFAYVFGTEKPRNTFGVRAGLDISPALWDCLGMQDNAFTSWRFVDAEEVPEGPWKKTITVSGISWLSEDF